MNKYLCILLTAFFIYLPALSQTDSIIHVYAMQQDEPSEIKPIYHRTTHTVRRHRVFVNYTEFAKETSCNSFEDAARFRITIPESSRYTIDDFGICLFRSSGGYRYLVTKVLSGHAARHCNDYSQGMSVTKRRINATTYEMTISGDPGQYGLALFVESSAGLREVYDFSLLGSAEKSNPKYSARNRRTKYIW